MSAQEDEPSTAPTPTPTTPSPPEPRQLIRVIQCPTCSLPLQEPFTLPCGRTVCQTCLPTPHERTSVTYPAHEDRRQGLRCPFFDCAKEHARGDCSVDITLRDAVAAVRAALEKGRESTVASDLSTRVGGLSLEETETTATARQGGLLLAAYTLAQQGGLTYDDDGEATPKSAVTESQAASDAELLAQVKEVTREDLECRLCLDILFEPVTTPCGHTLCRPCLHRALDSAKYCPICRASLSMRPAVYPSNRVLSEMAGYFWPDHLEKRRLMVADDEEAGIAGNTTSRGLFINHVAFPGVTEILHIFEPRYRIMIRRALRGDRIFGIVGRLSGGFSALGTLVRITDHEFMSDGRIFAKVVGISRFRVLESGTRDGHAVAKVQPISDISIAEEEEVEAAETSGNEDAGDSLKHMSPYSRPISKDEIDSTSTKALMELCLAYVEYMRDRSVIWVTPKLRSMYDLRPTDPAAFPWWFASVLPVGNNWKYLLLSLTSVRERLKLCWEWILEWEGQSWWTTLKFCSVM